MSIHPSLAVSEKSKKPRSVLKRSERLRMMLEKGQWKEGDEVCGLPKIKTLRIKIKKEKAEKAVEATATESAAAGTAAPSAAAGAKEKQAAPGKAPGAKGQDKK